MNKKIGIGIVSISTIPSAFALELGPLTDVLQGIFEIGSFVWVTDILSATKFALFVVIFAILYGVLHSGFVERTGVLQNKKISTVIAFSLAALSVIFIPNSVALGIGETYAAVTAIILAGLPTGILIYFGITLTRSSPKIIKHGIRLIAALAGIAILSGIGSEFGMFYIAPLFWRLLK